MADSQKGPRPGTALEGGPIGQGPHIRIAHKLLVLRAVQPHIVESLGAPEKALTWRQIRGFIASVMLHDVHERQAARLFLRLTAKAFKATEAQAQARGTPLVPTRAVPKEVVALLVEGLLKAVEEALYKALPPTVTKEQLGRLVEGLFKEVEEELRKALLPAAPIRYLETPSAHLYHNLRSAYAARGFSLPEGGGWPAADLSGAKKKLRALAQLRPDPKEVEPYLDPDELAACQEQMAKHVLALSDTTADVLDTIFAVWLREAEHPEATVAITADEFLRFRGVLSKKGGTGRRGGYRGGQRREIAHHIAILSNTWITVFEMDAIQEDEKGRRRQTKWRGESRAVVVSSRVGQVKWDLGTQRETLDVYAWHVRPGDVFARFLFGPGRQTALLSQRALAYDPYRQRWEKRLCRYLSWQWRIRQGGGGCLGPVRTRKLLEAAGEAVDANHPARTKARLEQALETLRKDGVIAAWRYLAAQEEVTGRRGWWKEWLDWKIIVEPPRGLVNHYAAHVQAQANPPAPAGHTDKAPLGWRVREARKARGLTLAQAAAAIGLSTSRLSEIESGRRPSIREDTRRRLLKWLNQTP